MTDERSVDAGELWEGEPEDFEPPVRSPMRRIVIGAVAALVAASMLVIPLWQVVDGLTPTMADNGLEVCGFDYCVVQAAVREAGHGAAMTRLANQFLDPMAAQAFADLLVAELGGAPVIVEGAGRMEGRTAGRYEPLLRRIQIEEPIRAWVVLHEVAHTEANGHGEEFQATLISLLERWESGRPGR